jgi:hypothetical protein
MQTSLRGIAEKSALHKDHRFQNLMGLPGDVILVLEIIEPEVSAWSRSGDLLAIR